MIRRLAPVPLILGMLAGCGNWQRVGSAPTPNQDQQTLSQLFDLTSVYRRLGRLAAGPPLPFVGSLSFVAGSGDSTIVLLALSLENRALVFQRGGRNFVAHYRVDLSVRGPADVAPVQAIREEVVRVGTFQETQRNDESILFQHVFHLAPGSYHFTVALRDRGSPSQSRVEGDYQVPALPDGSFSPPAIAYQVKARETRAEALAAVINPRGSAAYGGDTVLIYVEGYRMPGPRSVPFELRDQNDSLVLSDTLHFQGGREVESQAIRLSPDSAPLGELKVLVGDGVEQRRTSLLVSLSQAWVVTNYEEMLSLLRYFPETDRLATLKKAPAAERGRLWREFYVETDPNKLTPENEALETYFARVAVATQRYRDEGIAGWRTDRGELFITLGDPDETYDASPTSQGRIIRCTYTELRLTVFFQDESGFGHFRLTPASRAEYERVLNRVRNQSQ